MLFSHHRSGEGFTIASTHNAVKALIAHAEPILDKYGYAGIFIANFAEGTGIPLPGQTLLMAGALLALEDQYHIAAVVLLAFAASFLGSCLGFIIGRRGGRKLILKAPIDEEKLAGVETLFQQYAVRLVILSRFVDGFRQLTPLVAGSLEMRPLSFVLASLAGSALWVSVWGWGVYLLGPEFHHLLTRLSTMTPLAWLSVGLVLAALVTWLMVRRRNS